MIVQKDSPVKRIGDLKGKRVPIKYSNQKIAHRLFLAGISTAGLTEDDFDGVPVANVVAAAKEFVQGKLDATYFAVGAGKVKEMAAQVGGIRYLPAETTPEALERMRKYAPAAYIEIAQPRKSAPGIVGPTPMITETFVLFGGKHVSKEIIHKFLDTLYSSKAVLGKAYPRWKRYSPDKMWRKTDVPPHPEAVNWFKAKGLTMAK